MESMQLAGAKGAAQHAEEFAKRLHDSWGVGHKGCSDGVLLLLAVIDRQVLNTKDASARSCCVGIIRNCEEHGALSEDAHVTTPRMDVAQSVRFISLPPG